MKLYSENKDYKLYEGSMLDMLEVIEPNTIDSIVTDPPYELNFMGKGWDNSGIAFQPETWQKCYEVLKPGGYLLAFGGSRTFHRIACAIEDAGFEIRDTIMWLYGSGFPKSMDISKQIDKKADNNNEVIKAKEELGKWLKEKRGNRPQKEISKYFPSKTGGLTGCVANWEKGYNLPTWEIWVKLKKILDLDDRYDYLIEGRPSNYIEAEREVIGKMENPASSIYSMGENKMNRDVNITAPSTDLAKQWQGWGTALKPSFEPIIVARKPFKGSLVDNVIENDVGGINIDECRVETQDDLYRKPCENGSIYSQQEKQYTIGRFPANTILTYDESDFEEVCGGFPQSKGKGHFPKNNKNGASIFNTNNLEQEEKYLCDGGSASRYFYCAKASKKDRDEGIKEYYKIIISKEDCKCEESMARVQLLKKVIYDLEVENLNILEYGKNIMVIFPKECKFIILTEINKITELKTWNLLIHSLIKDYIADVNCEMENGGNHVENVENLKELKQIITSENQELVHGVSNAVYQMLLKIKNEENWQIANNSHCTVKPTTLMQYLVRLVTPNNGTILDPFNGSGSTGKAVMYENRERNKNYKYIGIELTEEYLPIAKARIEYVCNLIEEDKLKDKQMSIFDIGESNE